MQLIELPTTDETNDNIVAFWNPAQAMKPGAEHLLSYKLYWGSQPPFGSNLAKVVATRVGEGGVVGLPRTHYSRRFVIDFSGGSLASLPSDAKIEAVVSLSRGKDELVSVRPLDAVKGIAPASTWCPIKPRGPSTCGCICGWAESR